MGVGLRASDQKVDMICQLNKDATVIPMKLRLTDGDGLLQEYHIKSYRIVNAKGAYRMPNGVTVGTDPFLIRYECKISVLGKEEKIGLILNKRTLTWTLA